MLFKVYGRTNFLRDAHARIGDALHNAAMSALEAPADKRFHRFIGLEDWAMVAPPDRSERFLQIEVVMFSGRSVATRKAFVRAITEQLERALSLSTVDIEIVLIEAPRENWGIRGQHGDELELSYKVEL